MLFLEYADEGFERAYLALRHSEYPCQVTVLSDETLNPALILAFQSLKMSCVSGMLILQGHVITGERLVSETYFLDCMSREVGYSGYDIMYDTCLTFLDPSVGIPGDAELLSHGLLRKAQFLADVFYVFLDRIVVHHLVVYDAKLGLMTYRVVVIFSVQ